MLMIEVTPALLDMFEEVVGLVLREYTYPANVRINAVGESKIDDPVLAAKRNRGFCAPLSQVSQPAATTAGQNHCQSAIHKPAATPVWNISHKKALTESSVLSYQYIVSGQTVTPALSFAGKSAE
jgi:hypothetical protein